MIRDISIKAVMNGFLVRVGCQHMVFTDPDQLAKDLVEYLKDPTTIEKRYREQSINSKHTMDCPEINTDSLNRYNNACAAQESRPLRPPVSEAVGYAVTSPSEPAHTH